MGSGVDVALVVAGEDHSAGGKMMQYLAQRETDNGLPVRRAAALMSRWGRINRALQMRCFAVASTDEFDAQREVLSRYGYRGPF